MKQSKIWTLFMLFVAVLMLGACNSATPSEETQDDTPIAARSSTSQSHPIETTRPTFANTRPMPPAGGEKRQAGIKTETQPRPLTPATANLGQPSAAPPAPTPPATSMTTPQTLAAQDSPLGVAWGESSRPVDDFMTYIHDLGLPRTKVSFHWAELEPQPGQYDFQALDAYLDQLGPGDHALLNLFTDGWCTLGDEVGSRKGAPLRECPEGESQCSKHCDEYYREFVTKVAEEVRDRAHGGIRYMQRDTEPASMRHFPADAPAAYVELQHIYYQAVKNVLPDMTIIGVNHNGNFDAHGRGEPQSADFFDYVLQHSKDDYDLLDVRLYGDLYAIPHRVAWFREHMNRYGYEKPIVSTEYGGVDPRTLHNEKDYIFQKQLKEIESHCRSDNGEPQQGCARKWAREHPDQIDPKLHPFFGIASEEEQAHYEQLHCYDIVQRSVMALSEGVQALWWWNLQSPGTDLIFGQMRLRTPDMEELPGYPCFRRFAHITGDVTQVQKIDVGEPEVYFFEVKRADGSSIFVAWYRKDNLDAYDAAAAEPVNVSLPVPFSQAEVTGILGDTTRLGVSDGNLTLALSNEPIFIGNGGDVSIPQPVVTPRPVPSPPPTPTWTENPRVGLNFIRFYYADTPPFQPETIFQDFADSGVQLYRHPIETDLAWRKIEPRDDEWHFEAADSILLDSPIPFIATVFDYSYSSGTPPWCTDSSKFQKTLGPEALDYLAHVVDRYGPYVKYWEIGNEMEHWMAAAPGRGGTGGRKVTPLPDCVPADGFSPQEQGRFLAQAARYIREHDPDAVILMPGTIGLSDYSLNTWFEGVLEGGGSDWFDIVNYHYYGPWQRYLRLRADLDTFLQTHGLTDRPIWHTETGSTSSPTLTQRTDYPNSLQSQAADVFRRLVQAWGSGDQLVIWHTYIGSEDTPNNVWREYGLREADGSAKPALYSFRLLTHELIPFRQVTPVRVEPRGMNLYRVEREDGGIRYVVWGSGSFTVPEGLSQMTQVVPDAQGNFAWQQVTPGQQITLTDIPILLK